jgi:HEAT repeat protein
MPFSAPNVAKLRARGDTEGLAKATRYKHDAQVREDARLALCEQIDFLIGRLDTRNLRQLLIVRDALVACGPPAVDAMIFVHTDHQSVHRRQDTAYVLGMTRDPKAVPALLDALRDSDAALRMVAAEALGKVGDPRAAEALRLTALNDPNGQVRKAASKAYNALSEAD